MGKTKITIEHPLATKSVSLVWRLISSDHGLQKWMADEVKQDNGEITFTWGEPWTAQDIRKSTIIAMKPNKFIRLKWEENESDEDYWELRIEKSDFSGSVCLIITDHVDPEDKEYMEEVWNHDLEKLHRATGL